MEIQAADAISVFACVGERWRRLLASLLSFSALLVGPLVFSSPSLVFFPSSFVIFSRACSGSFSSPWVVGFNGAHLNPSLVSGVIIASGAPRTYVQFKAVDICAPAFSL